MQVKGLDWTGILVEDYKKAQQFFVEKLGLTLQFEAKKHVITHFRLPSGQLFELYGPDNRQRIYEKFRWFNGQALGFDVDDLVKDYQEMVDRGVHFIREIETWQEEAWAMFLGPENELLQIQNSGHQIPRAGSKLLRYSWAAIVVQDFAAAVRFFSETMELPLAQLEDSKTSAQFWLPKGHHLQIIGPDHPWSAFLKGITIGFEVEDIQQAQQELKQNGVEFFDTGEANSQDHPYAFFYGPENSTYALWKPSEKIN